MSTVYTRTGWSDHEIQKRTTKLLVLHEVHVATGANAMIEKTICNTKKVFASITKFHVGNFKTRQAVQNNHMNSA